MKPQRLLIGAPVGLLYASAGFATCAPFGDYRPSPNSTFMSLTLISRPSK